MRFLLSFTAAALLLAVGMGGMASATAADREARAAVQGRQKIREELNAALAKGYLTRMDQYHILLHAKEVLTDDDLRGLEQTLDRIARQQAAAHAAATATRADTTAAPKEAPAPKEETRLPKATPAPKEMSVPRSTDDSEPQVITPSSYEEAQDATMPDSGKSMAKKAKASPEPSIIEEVPAGIGKPSMRFDHLDSDDPENCGCDEGGCGRCFRWLNIECFSGIDAFKGPMDLGNANGNFGTDVGVNAAVPIFPRLGVAFQAGTSVVFSNLKGSPYPEPNAATRDQIFTTVGMFQRINREEGAFAWGFAYDWLFDDYYSNFHFGQWRVKAAWEFNPCNEVGISAAVPEHGSMDPDPNLPVSFKPITQGFLYWRHTFGNDASLTGRLGMAERPGLFLFGAESRVPLTKNLALTSDFSYIMPNDASGPIAQQQEIWNVSVGLEFVLGGVGRGCAGRFQPFIPVANNGSLAVRETDASAPR